MVNGGPSICCPSNNKETLPENKNDFPAPSIAPGVKCPGDGRQYWALVRHAMAKLSTWAICQRSHLDPINVLQIGMGTTPSVERLNQVIATTSTSLTPAWSYFGDEKTRGA